MKKTTNPRVLSALIITKVIKNRQSLNDALKKGLENTEESKKPLVQAMTYGVLRWHVRLNALLDLLVEKPLKEKDTDIQALLLVGLYQLQYMNIPPHAALNETVSGVVGLKKPWAKGLVNGVLRNFQRQQEHVVTEVDKDPAKRFSHPEWLYQEIKAAWPEEWENILNANNQQAPLTLRVNQTKTTSSVGCDDGCL